MKKKQPPQTNSTDLDELIALAVDAGKVKNWDIAIYIISISPHFKRMGYKHLLEKIEELL